MFAYRITIENHNNFSVKLQRRHWHIFDSNGSYREVEGEGVVGVQPILQPGERYQYVSGCNLRTEMGKMYGSYTMENLNNKKSFEVNIPIFEMIVSIQDELGLLSARPAWHTCAHIPRIQVASPCRPERPIGLTSSKATSPANLCVNVWYNSLFRESNNCLLFARPTGGCLRYTGCKKSETQPELQ